MTTKKNNESHTEVLHFLVSKIPATRKENRIIAVQNFAERFLKICFERGTIVFPKEELNFLVEDLELEERQKRNITHDILNYLTDNKLITPHKVSKAIYTMRNIPLTSLDGGSYETLMKRNGYKRVLFKFVKKDNSAPRKVRVKTLELNEEIPQDLDFDITELISSKPLENQGVITNSHKSVVKGFCFYSEKLVYQIN